MPAIQANLFDFAKKPTVRAISTAPVVWSPEVQSSFDLALYRLYRSNALWFATRMDGYSTATKHGAVVVPKGNSCKCSKFYFQSCVNLYPRVTTCIAKHCQNEVGSVETKQNSEPCLCLDCLKSELVRLSALRTDTAEFHFSSEEELGK